MVEINQPITKKVHYEKDNIVRKTIHVTQDVALVAMNNEKTYSDFFDDAVRAVIKKCFVRSKIKKYRMHSVGTSAASDAMARIKGIDEPQWLYKSGQYYCYDVLNDVLYKVTFP